MIIEQENLVKQLLYRSIHRGCKETDFLIGEFAKAKIFEFDLQKLQLFKSFIEEDDLLIYDWILKKENLPAAYKQLIGEINQFHFNDDLFAENFSNN
jgi:antitoxin CptB